MNVEASSAINGFCCSAWNDAVFLLVKRQTGASKTIVTTQTIKRRKI